MGDPFFTARKEFIYFLQNKLYLVNLSCLEDSMNVKKVELPIQYQPTYSLLTFMSVL